MFKVCAAGIIPVVLMFFFSSCVPKGASASAPGAVEGEEGFLALVIPGAFPLWFELNSAVPVQISSPDESVPLPFTPWPSARHIAGMTVGKGRLVMAVNREGLLILAPREEALALYWLQGGPAWESYTVGAVFRYQENPAALLYRNDFFLQAESASRLPPPLDRVWGLTGAFQLMPIGGAFADMPAQEGWNLEDLRFGRDGLWHYRGARESSSQREVRYSRAVDLEVPGKMSSFGLFTKAAVPYTANEAPKLLGMVLEGAVRLVSPVRPIAAVVSPAFPGLRYYTGNSGIPQGTELDTTELAGFYREGEGAEGALAALVFPGGRLLYAAEPDGTARLRLASLPPLPEGFFYTRIGMAGSALIAAWEEQEHWNTGAAGFLVIAMPDGADY
ncbi:MAG: hypothetical protein LBD37_01675 [Treponema sp.]|jgi:hypothetical protein|nr:hypothetical protein [Treponema sp.]